MESSQICKAILQREPRPGGAFRVVALVAAAIEYRGDPVADELLHLAAELTHNQRRRDAPVSMQDLRHLGRRGAFREARKARQIAEEDTYHLTAFARRWQIEVTESLVMPLALCRE